MSPLLVGLCLLFSISLGVGQLLFKYAAADVQARMNVSLLYAAFSPILIASVAFYGLVTLLYVYLLMKLPLSKAYTFSLFGSALVPLLAYTILGETLSLRYIFALAIVVAGLVLMHG